MQVSQTAGLMVELRNDLFLYGEGLTYQDRVEIAHILKHIEAILADPLSKADARALTDDVGWEALRKMFNIATHTRYEMEDAMPDPGRNIAMFGLLQHITHLVNARP